MQNIYIPHCSSAVSEQEINNMHPLTLSFVGDAVQTLYVRSKLSLENSVKTNVLHSLTSHIVNATSQSSFVDQILPMLTPRELEIYKRARNSKISTSAKHSTILEYKRASGYEALIGYLYLTNQNDRMEQLLTINETIEPKEEK